MNKISSEPIVVEEELMNATGYFRRADLMKCLKKQNITFCLGKRGRIWTTLGAINSSLISQSSTRTSYSGLE